MITKKYQYINNNKEAVRYNRHLLIQSQLFYLSFFKVIFLYVSDKDLF